MQDNKFPGFSLKISHKTIVCSHWMYFKACRKVTWIDRYSVTMFSLEFKGTNVRLCHTRIVLTSFITSNFITYQTGFLQQISQKETDIFKWRVKVSFHCTYCLECSYCRCFLHVCVCVLWMQCYFLSSKCQSLENSIISNPSKSQWIVLKIWAEETFTNQKCTKNLSKHFGNRWTLVKMGTPLVKITQLCRELYNYWVYLCIAPVIVHTVMKTVYPTHLLICFYL